MKKTILFIVIISCFLGGRANSTGNQQTSLSGKITDNNGKPLIGVSLYFAELKQGTVTDNKGFYQFSNLPKRNMFIQITALGYKMIAENINLNLIEKRDFVLSESIVEINEIVVTGQTGVSQLLKMPGSISIVTQQELQQNSSTNLIDAISSQPGISQITTGNGISKPVIRGLGFNRVVVLNDGIRQEGQQWGNEHGVEIDENEVSRVEIMKGPASLMYGSDALAGVINFVSSPYVSEGKTQLNALANYQTNNGLMAYSLNFAGHKNKFVWDMRYSHKQAHAYQNKIDGFVHNSGFSENAATGMFGISDWWGYSHLTLSTYQLKPGIVEGDRDSASGQFIKPVILSDGSEGEAIATRKDFLSYKNLMPYQQVKHYKAVWNTNILLGEGSLKAIVGYQQNRRQEFADFLNPKIYELYFQLHTLNYNAHYVLPEKNGYEFSIGTNGMYQHSLNKGIEFLVPEYQLLDAGLFTIAKKSVGKLHISGGFRYDRRFVKGESLYINAEERFAAFKSNYDDLSGSIGASYQLNENWNTKLNLSRGFRAPNISELGSNGVHEGTNRYETGNSDLKAENSLQLDYELWYNTEHVSAKVNLFRNNVSNYIFSHKLNSQLGGDSIVDGSQVFKFDSGDAQLMGGEATIDIHPHPFDWLHFENSFSYINAQLKNQTDSTRYLPFTPGAKLTSKIRIDFDKAGKYLKNTFFAFGLEHNFRQNNVYSAYRTETITPEYTLLNASIGADIVYKQKTACSVYVIGTNLTDVAYQNHLSRLKYTATNNKTGREGVFNMGRNISLKLIVPVEW